MKIGCSRSGWGFSSTSWSTSECRFLCVRVFFFSLLLAVFAHDTEPAIHLTPPTTKHFLVFRLSALDDSVKITLKKLADGDKDQQRRIAELEARVGAKVAKEVEEKLSGGGAELGSRLASIEKQVAGEVLPRVAAMSQAGQGWVKPFVGLTVVVCGLSIWFLCFRSWSKKKHSMKLP